MLNADRLTVKAAEVFNESISLARENGNPLVYDGPPAARIGWAVRGDRRPPPQQTRR